jgi:multiple sugar transport system substrate-binding protein
MHKRSRTLTLASAAVLTGLALSACSGGGGNSAAPQDAEGEVAGEIQYAWWGGPARNDRTQAVIDLYEKANPEVTVQGTTAEFAAYWENLTVQAAGKNLPCVPQMQNRTMADYADRGALMALDDIVESGAIDVSNIPESVLDSGRGADGKLYMIPYGAAFGSLLVNVTDIEELGLELPEEGYDWKWLEGWFNDITEKTGQPATGALGNQQDVLEAWFRSHGEDFYDKGQVGFTEDTLVDYWDYSNELRESGASISAERASELTGIPLEQNPFTQGQQPTLFWPANGLGTAQATIDQAAPGHELRAFPLPSGEEGLGNAFWLSGLSISANCDNVATAASFIDFFVNDEDAAVAFASDNGANTNTENLKALLDSPDTTPAKKAELELYSYLAEEGVAPTVYGKAYASIFQESLTRYYQQVSFGELSVEEAAKQYLEEAKGTLG